MPKVVVAKWSLIFGLALVFLFFGFDKYANPIVWIGWIPTWMDGLLGLSKNIWLQLIGATEILIGIGLVIPFRPLRRFACAAAAIQLIAVLTQVGWNDVGARDVGLLMMSVGLWFLL